MLIAVKVIRLLHGSNKGTDNSNGERIYFAATIDRGQRISYNGGPVFGGMMILGQLTWAYCHGVDGRGNQYSIHMRLMDAPDIRWAALAGPDTFR